MAGALGGAAMHQVQQQGGGSVSAPTDLLLRTSCGRCGGTSGELFAASCRHMTLCMACGKAMAEAASPCTECKAPVKTLIKEYKVRRYAPGVKQFFLGRFPQGLPSFSSKSGVHWSMRRDIPRPGDPAREKYKLTPERIKTKPWILEDDTGAQQFQGQLEGGQQAIYYILVKHGKDFHAIPAGSWYNFHKFVQYKQLTLEEAEEQMKNRRRTADGYQRWMMKAANTGATAFGEVDRAAGAGGGRKKGAADEDDEGNKKKTNNKTAKDDDEDDDLARAEDFDPEDEVERGDDWEHEETFTDDDEAVGNDPEEREDQGPEVPAPPEIKQEEDEMEAEEGQTQEGGGLSQSGRDMKKLLGKAAGLDESDGEEDEEDEDVDLDNEDLSSPVLAPTKRKDGSKEEPVDATPTKTSPGNARPAGAAASGSKSKRKATEEAKGTTTTAKKSKNDSREIKKETPANTNKKDVTKKEPGVKAAASPSASGTGPVTEEEVKTALRQSGPLRSQDLVSKFRSRLRTQEEKSTFADVLKKISRIQKRDGASYIVLK